VIEYAIFSPWASSAIEAAKQTKFGTKVALRMRMIPELQIHAYHTTLDDEK